MRHRLRDVAQRAAGRRRDRSTACRSAGSVSRTSATHRLRPALRSRLQAAAFGRRRARLARRRRTGQPGAGRLIDRNAARYDYFFFFSYRYYHAYHGARAAPSRAVLVPTAERDAAIGLSIFQPIFRGVRALMYNSPEERAMIQAVAGNQQVPSVVVGIGSDVPANPQPATVPAEVQHPRPVRGVCRPHRREQGLQGAVRASSSTYLQRTGAPVAGPGRQFAAADPGAPAHPPSRLPRRRRQVRRDGGRRAADHAVVLREPLDGGARGLGPRPAGARQRQVRRAEGPVHPQQRRAVLRNPRRSSSRRCARIEHEPLAERRARAERPPVLPRALRLAGHRAEVSRHARALAKEPAGPGIEPLPGWFARRRRIVPPRERWRRRSRPGPSFAAERLARSTRPSPRPRRGRRRQPAQRRSGAERDHSDRRRRGWQARPQARRQRPGGA